MSATTFFFPTDGVDDAHRCLSPAWYVDGSIEECKTTHADAPLPLPSIPHLHSIRVFPGPTTRFFEPLSAPSHHLHDIIVVHLSPGAPRPNARAYVLDHKQVSRVPSAPDAEYERAPTVCETGPRFQTYMPQVPRGQEGELCLGGVYLALGYLNRPDLTENAFIHHPELGRLYRTGDLVKLDAKVNKIHFVGRIDYQTKIRGHRVELHGIEMIISKVIADEKARSQSEGKKERIKQVAGKKSRGKSGEDAGEEDHAGDVEERETVVGGSNRGPPGVSSSSDKFDTLAEKISLAVVVKHRERLVAFLQVEAVDNTPEVRFAPRPFALGLRKLLGERLAAYAIPSSFVLVASFPRLVSSAKVDRGALKGLYDVVLIHELGRITSGEEGGGGGPSARTAEKAGTTMTNVSSDVTECGGSRSGGGDSSTHTRTRTAPTPAALELLTICRGVLDAPLLKYTDDFFLDAAADSLSIARLANTLTEAMDTQSVSV